MADLKNVALVIEAHQTVADLKQWLGISEQMDVIRLGFAYAIKNNLDLDRPNTWTPGGSNYDAGGLDEDGLMSETVRLFYPDTYATDEPYRAMSVLMNKGVLLLAEHWREGLIGSISDLVEL